MSRAGSVSVEGLRVSAGDRTLLRDVSVSLQAGDALVVLGESGAGKSLFAQAMMGTLPAGLRASGEIRLAGVPSAVSDVAARRAVWGRGIALLPQEPEQALDPLVTLGGQARRLRMRLGHEPPDQARQRVNAALDAIGLHGTAERYPWQLSGGMAQRATTMLALTGGAPVLIADEPTKGLDSVWRDHVVGLLRDLRAAGGCVIVVTHDLRVARALAGQLLVLQSGEVVERGATLEVLEQPSHPFTRRLLDADPSRWCRYPEPMRGAPLLDARDLAKRFGDRTVFAGVSFELKAGDRLAVLGPSGVGKSTLGDMALGLVSPDEGRVVRHVGPRMGTFQKLYQDPVGSFAPARRLLDTLRDVATLHGLAWAVIERLLGSLGIDGAMLERRPAQVSGGELQRIALARALAVGPAVLFADEPTSRLDPVTQQRAMSELMAAVIERGIGLLFVTHDDDIAAVVGTRILRLAPPAPPAEMRS
ncbi:MAG: ABC transporter ATP-binding protein [Burkholderiales bacterium]|nr:MAG: ABC transporter ATP-binding protein [Burkholderiales bacterium]